MRVIDRVTEVAEALDHAGVYFGHGTDNAWDEATALVLFCAELPDEAASAEVLLSGPVLESIQTLLARRIDERIPLPYLTGQCQFAGLTFDIEPGVLIPRSPIVHLIERAYGPWLRVNPERVLDLCCGSGCIGIATALCFLDAEVVMSDISEQACDLAERNVRKHGLTDRVTVVQSDLFESLPGDFQLIVSNPPYVDAADLAAAPPEFAAEPQLALAAGEDGLSIVRGILDGARAQLCDDGFLICEVGNSAPALLRSFPDLPFIWPVLSSEVGSVFALEAQDLDSHTARSRTPAPD